MLNVKVTEEPEKPVIGELGPVVGEPSPIVRELRPVVGAPRLEGPVVELACKNSDVVAVLVDNPK